jgi:hypothetical protein
LNDEEDLTSSMGIKSSDGDDSPFKMEKDIKEQISVNPFSSENRIPNP